MGKIKGSNGLLGRSKTKFNKRRFDVGLISPFGPREARPKRRKIVPRARGTIFRTCRVHVKKGG
jgi:hypothetical protein